MLLFIAYANLRRYNYLIINIFGRNNLNRLHSQPAMEHPSLQRIIVRSALFLSK